VGQRPQRGHTEDDSQVEVSNESACELEGRLVREEQQPDYRLVEIGLKGKK
jgi:hypothetical protein